MSEYRRLNQAKNEVAIEGVFSQLELHEGTTRPNQYGQTKEYVRGNVTFEVEQTIGQEKELELIPVSFWISKLKNNGDPNPAYENIMNLQNLKRKSTDGDLADYIALSTFGDIRENIYINKYTGQLTKEWRVNGSFFTKINVSPNPKAVFKVKIVIRSIDEETVDNIPTGRLLIRGVIIQYGGRADVVDFVVEDKNAYAHIYKNFKEQQTVIVAGFIRFTYATKDTPQESETMIGQEVNMTSSSTFRKKELVITSVSPYPLTDEDAYDFDLVCEALNERKAKIDRLEAERARATPQQQTASAPDRGW